MTNAAAAAPDTAAPDLGYAPVPDEFRLPQGLNFGPCSSVAINSKGQFDADGNFVKTWGGEGTGPGQFNVPHSIVIDRKGLIYVADRSNQRIQVFDADGVYVRESKHPGTPCGLCMCHDQRHIMLAHGHTGRIMKLDLNGNVLGATGGQGKGPNQYGEAHFLALDAKEDIYIADTLNWRVQKLARR